MGFRRFHVEVDYYPQVVINRDGGGENAEGKVVANAMVPMPIRLLASEDAEAVQIGNAGGDHGHETLPGGEARQQICGAPAGHNVDGNLQVRNCIRKAERALGNCALAVSHFFRTSKFQHYLDSSPRFSVGLLVFGLGAGALEYVRG